MPAPIRSFRGRFGSVLLLAVVCGAASTALRIALIAAHSAQADLDAAVLARILAAGVGYDAAAAAWIVLPACAWAAAAPAFAPSGLGRALGHVWYVSAVFLVLFMTVAEWLFFAEFGARFNFIAVDYLVYTTEVIGNIRQSYPVGKMLAALVVVAVDRLRGSPSLGRGRRRATPERRHALRPAQRIPRGSGCSPRSRARGSSTAR